MQRTVSTPVGSRIYRNVRIKLLQENGAVERHSFNGDLTEFERFLEKAKGKVMEIQILCISATKDKEKDYAATKTT